MQVLYNIFYFIMKFDARFRLAENSHDAAEVAGVLLAPRLWIPTTDEYGLQRHAEWVAETEAEISDGKKGASRIIRKSSARRDCIST